MRAAVLQVAAWRRAEPVRIPLHLGSFRTLLGDNLERLSFEERQAITQCLVNKVIVEGEEVDIFVGCVWRISVFYYRKLLLTGSFTRKKAKEKGDYRAE